MIKFIHSFFKFFVEIYRIKIFLICSFLSMVSCSRIIDHDPKEISSQTRDELIDSELSLVKNYLDKGEPGSAWQNLRPLYQAQKNNPKVLNMVGLTHLSLENYSKAIQIFKKAFELDSKASYGLNLSSAYISIGYFKKARSIVIKLLKTKKNYRFKERLWHNLALSFEREKNIPKAIKYYNKALKINPSFILTLLKLAKLYKNNNQPNLAINYYKKAHAYCQICFEPLNALASHYISQGRYQLAEKSLKKFIKLKNTGEKDRQNAKDLLSLAQSLNHRKRG